MMHYKWVCQIQFKVTNMSGASAIPQRGNIDFILILLANGILSAAMPMLIVLGGLAGLMLAPTPIFSTLPASIQMFAGLLAAAPMAWCMGKFGRKLRRLQEGGHQYRCRCQGDAGPRVPKSIPRLT